MREEYRYDNPNHGRRGDAWCILKIDDGVDVWVTVGIRPTRHPVEDGEEAVDGEVEGRVDDMVEPDGYLGDEEVKETEDAGEEMDAHVQVEGWFLVLRYHGAEDRPVDKSDDDGGRDGNVEEEPLQLMTDSVKSVV